MEKNSQNKDDMEMEQLKSDLHKTMKMVELIKDFLLGNETLDTHGMKHDVHELQTGFDGLNKTMGEISGKVVHIFKWRDQYVMGRKERREDHRNQVELWLGRLSIAYIIVQALIELAKWHPWQN